MPRMNRRDRRDRRGRDRRWRLWRGQGEEEVESDLKYHWKYGFFKIWLCL